MARHAHSDQAIRPFVADPQAQVVDPGVGKVAEIVLARWYGLPAGSSVVIAEVEPLRGKPDRGVHRRWPPRSRP